MIDIIEWAESPAGFYVDRHYDAGAGRWVLEVAPIKLADYHAAILKHLFTPDDSGRLPYDVVAWCEPAKSGKSAIAGLVAEWMALHGERNSQIVMASNKQRQAASIMFKSLTDSVEYNPHLPNVDPGKLAVSFRNGNTVTAIPSSSRSEAGARFSLVLFDELAGYVYQDAQRLWSEFKTDPTRLNSVKLAIGYAGYIESELWLETLNTGLAGEPVPELANIVNDDSAPACWANGRHFTFWSHVCRQPWQTLEWIASQRKALRAPEFSRMILCDFVEGQGDFIDAGTWETLIDPELEPLPAGSPKPVYIGLDLALKPGGDDCALIGLYGLGDKLAVGFYRLWKGGKERREDLSVGDTVEPYIYRLCSRYNVAAIGVDPWQAMGLCQRLAQRGLPMVEVPQTHGSRGRSDTLLYELVTGGELVLYDTPDLRSAASGASAKELGNGLLFIRKAGRAKIDLLISMSNAIYGMAHEPVRVEWVYRPKIISSY